MVDNGYATTDVSGDIYTEGIQRVCSLLSYVKVLMHVGGTAFLYIIHTYGGGLFFIVFVDILKINNAKFTSYPIH